MPAVMIYTDRIISNGKKKKKNHFKWSIDPAEISALKGWYGIITYEQYCMLHQWIIQLDISADWTQHNNEGRA